LRSYLQAHNMIRGITGTGEGNGPFISIHDGFNGTAAWAGFLPGSDRIILDTHPYFAFDQQPNDAPIATSEDPASAGGIWPHQACSAWGPAINTRYGFLFFLPCGAFRSFGVEGPISCLSTKELTCFLVQPDRIRYDARGRVQQRVQ
jgi:hypothetical protein